MVEPPPLGRADEIDGRCPIDWSVELDRHRPWLRSVVRGRLGDWETVDDVLQEVFSGALSASSRPNDPGKIAPWLYRIALKQCLMQRRRLGRRRKLMAEIAEQRSQDPENANDPIDWLMGRERRTAVQEALHRLNPIDRHVFVLKHSENWTYQQLADRLGCTVHTIEHRLLRARQQMRKELAALGVTGAAS